MRAATAMTRRREATVRVRDLMQEARIIGMTNSDLLDCYGKIVATCLKDCPGWVRYYVSGVFDEACCALYRDNTLVHGAIIKGEFYSTNSARPDYYWRDGGFSPAEFAAADKESSGHYWVHNLKPFFVEN